MCIWTWIYTHIIMHMCVSMNGVGMRWGIVDAGSSLRARGG